MLLLRAEVVGPVNLVVVRLNSNRLPMEVLVKPYNPSWAVAFDSASELVMNAMGFNAIEACHIGSTAIPNIWAKPIIDMMITVTNIDTVDTCNQAMAKLGYEANGEFGIPARRYFRKDDKSGKRTHQIHIFPPDSDHVQRHLAFRDFMNVHPKWAIRYSDLKRGLAAKHPHSIADYIAGKDAFIKHVDTIAAKWRRKTTG